jgi:hypothetical protein
MTKVIGAGNSNSILHYNQEDDAPFAPITYYKLKQVDFDGQYTYSDIIAIERPMDDNASDAVKVYPNPATTLIHIEDFSLFETTAQITIMDMFDQVVLLRDETLHKGMNTLTYDISPFAKGVYFVHVKSVATGNSVMKRFVKK